MDTADNDLITSFCFNCNCIFLVYDKSCFDSFLNIQGAFTTLCKVIEEKNGVNILVTGYNSENATDFVSKEIENSKVTFFEIENSDKKNQFNVKLIDFASRHNRNDVANLKKIMSAIYMNPKTKYTNPKHLFSLKKKEENEDYTIFKIILLGDWSVGKSAFFNRFFSKEFSNSYVSTIGVAVSNKYLVYNNKNIKLQIWDTAGQERFRAVTKQYYNKADGVLILFDLTKAETFESLQGWLEEMEEQKSKFLIYILGNKLDLTEERKITKDKVLDFLKDRDIRYIEVSCKWDLNIADATYQMLMDLYNCSTGKGKLIKNQSLKRGGNDNKKGCC